MHRNIDVPIIATTPIIKENVVLFILYSKIKPPATQLKI